MALLLLHIMKCNMHLLATVAREAFIRKLAKLTNALSSTQPFGP